jgi:hypothetical protein
MNELAKLYLNPVNQSSYGMLNLSTKNTSNGLFMFRLYDFPSDESVFEVDFEALI